MIDIDYFKHFNDKYGHQIGDEILKKLGGLLKKFTQNNGICARYGGEEFIILLPEFNANQTYLFADNLRQSIKNLKISNNDYFWKITASLGTATFPDDTKDINKLISFADTALYYSKSNGRNKVSRYKYDILK